MLEKNQRFKSLLYVLADAALLFIGFLLANYIRFNYVRYFEPGGAGPALAVARDPRNIIAGLATSLVLVSGPPEVRAEMKKTLDQLQELYR